MSTRSRKIMFLNKASMGHGEKKDPRKEKKAR
jgi:hypothetical protein